VHSVPSPHKSHVRPRLSRIDQSNNVWWRLKFIKIVIVQILSVFLLHTLRHNSLQLECETDKLDVQQMQCTEALTNWGKASNTRTKCYSRMGATKAVQCVVRQGWMTDLLTRRDPHPARSSAKWADTEVLIVWTGTVPKQGRENATACAAFIAQTWNKSRRLSEVEQLVFGHKGEIDVPCPENYKNNYKFVLIQLSDTVSFMRELRAMSGS
jgi:hypothetical protein